MPGGYVSAVVTSDCSTDDLYFLDYDQFKIFSTGSENFKYIRKSYGGIKVSYKEQKGESLYLVVYHSSSSTLSYAHVDYNVSLTYSVYDMSNQKMTPCDGNHCVFENVGSDDILILDNPGNIEEWGQLLFDDYVPHLERFGWVSIPLGFALLAAIVVIASATVTYTPPQRKCGWNLELTHKINNGVVDITKYWNYGLFYAKEIRDGAGKVKQHAVLRPDLDNKTFVYDYSNSKCTTYDKVGSVAFWVDDIVSLKYFEYPTVFASSSTDKYDGKECTKYIYPLGGVSFFVDKDGEPVALVTGNEALEFDYGGRASMSAFSLGSDEKGCEDASYKSGNDDYAFCAASTVKAALALVLAAVAALLAF